MQKDSRIIAAILAADVVEYSRLMAADEPGTLAALKTLRAIFAGQVAEFGGREFGSVGDSLMAEFPSAVNAVAAALAIQDAVAAENAVLPHARRMLLRAGVNLGDVIEEKGSFFGDAVNVAARLQALAKPGGVLISGSVYDQVHAKLEARYVDAGTRQVKNIREPVRTYELLPPAAPGIGGRVAAALTGLASRRILRGALVGVAVGTALALGLFWRHIPVPATGGNLGSVFEPETDSSSEKTLAVLPFINLTGDPANDYLGDGLAEEIMRRLARIPGLRVSARGAAFAYKGKDVDVREIADDLGVNYVVEGSIRQQGGVVRVSAALVERATGSNRWLNSYEHSGDFFVIEEDIGNQVLTALEVVLGAGSESSLPRAGDNADYEFYLQGLSYLRQPKSERTLDAAEELFLRSLQAQPDFARAQAGLCEVAVERYTLENQPSHVAAAEVACARAQALDRTAFEIHEAVGRLRLETGAVAEAEQAYRRALALAPESPDALMGLANALEAAGKLEEAGRVYLQAIASQPRYAAAHLAHGSFLFRAGRSQDAIAPFQRATELTPDNPSAFNNLGTAYLYVGDFERAAAALTRSLAIEPRRASYSNLATVLYYRKRYPEAIDNFRKAIELAPADHRLWGNLADALDFSGQNDEAGQAYRRALELVEAALAVNPRHAVNLAQTAYYAGRLGFGDRARQSIHKALAEGNSDNTVHYYVARAELELGSKSRAVSHARRALELGYPEVLLRAAPELEEIRKAI